MSSSPPNAGFGSADADAIDLRVVDEIVAKLGRERSAAIPILQAIQESFRYLPDLALRRVCEISEITPAQVEGVASFYNQFRRMPTGQYLISVCHGTACHVAGAEAITEQVRRYLGIEGEADTDPARRFTVQKVACLGCCSLAPVMRIEDKVYGRLTPDSVGKCIERFLSSEARRKKEMRRAPIPQQRRPAPQIRIGLGSCCIASGSAKVKDRIEAAARAMGLSLDVKCGGCVGMCHRVPLLEFPNEVRYGNVIPEAASPILRHHFRPTGLLCKTKALLSRIWELLSRDSAWISPDRFRIEQRSAPVRAFLEKQKHIVLEGCGQMDPLDIDEYIARDGYKALETCLRKLAPEEIIAIVRESGLRGRGGAGFPTGEKWAVVRSQPGREKFIVMNGDEGDPGAFMDRMMLESYPHRVLEGIAIASFAVGAEEGYLYIRAEYPLALERIREAIRQAEERHLLGENILGSSHCLRLHIMEGAGAFVCGEETALLASIEGRRGMPRFRPPYPAESGLWGKPTSINNVETYATIPWIIRNGPQAFAAIGTESSKGTKVFALAGKVVRGGLIEVPMGITIGEIVEEIGGGIRDGRKFKAVQIGGPSGGCIPSSLRHVRVDYEELNQYGAIMGSGGFVVMDDTTCMVDIARYFLQFTQNESCGKCTFCRIGTKRMLEILDRLCAGEGHRDDLKELEELAHRVKQTSLCGLGQTAPNPVLTTLRYFREEYEAHLSRRCPAHKCRALITYRIIEACFGCTLCAQHCPASAIEPRPYERHEIDLKKCIRCGTCKNICPADAVEVE